MKNLKEILLKPKDQPLVPLDADVIVPSVFANRTKNEIENLKIWQGNRQVKLADFFDVNGNGKASPQEIKIIIDGNVSRTKHIGENMKAGEILILGDVGMYVGAQMSGGKILIKGNAGAWAGQEMIGGELAIDRNAENYLGSAYRGGLYGMKGGTIIVKGSAGNEIGEWMSGGKIIVKGNVGSFAGVHMQGGVIIVKGNAKDRVGAEMKAGTILIGKHIESVLPSFLLEGEVKDPIIESESFSGNYFKFKGDSVIPSARGILYLSSVFNKHILI